MALEYAQKVGYGEWLGNAEPRFVSKKTSGPKSGSLSREETSRGPALKNQNAASGAGLDSSSSAAGKSCNQGDKEYHQENEEQEFRDSGGCDSHATKPENSGDNRNDQEYQRPIKHTCLLLVKRVFDIRSEHSESICN